MRDLPDDILSDLIQARMERVLHFRLHVPPLPHRIIVRLTDQPQWITLQAAVESQIKFARKQVPLIAFPTKPKTANAYASQLNQ